MSRLLLVEDDAVIADVILFYLGEEGDYQVDHVTTAGEALAAARRPYDLILLDVMLPDVDGTRLCARLRDFVFCPIIFISCIDDEEAIVRALEMGGDDYLTKPFSCKVLRGRIEANLRRVRMDRLDRKPLAKADYGDFRVDVGRRVVERADGCETHLGPIEFAMLEYLLAHPGRTVSPDELYETVWGKPSYGDVRTVIVHVSNLRKAVESDRSNPVHIVSVRGYGYLFSPAGGGSVAPEAR